MSRASRLNRTIRRAVERQLEKAAPKKAALRAKVVRILIVVIGIPGVLAGLLALLPRVSVTPSDPVDAENPFSASFTITNINFIPLRHVDAYVGIRHIQNRVAERPYCAKFSPVNGSWHNHTLDMDEKFTITLSDLYQLEQNNEPLNLHADIAVIIEFNPWLLPFHREKMFRFIARQQTNHQYYWYSAAIDPDLHCE